MKFLAAFAALAFASAAQAAVPAEWTAPQAPFRIIGNTYYVGTKDLAVYLIASPKGDVLIDGALVQTVPQIEKNIAALGFKLSGIKLILNTHAHYDHAAGLAQLKKDTGARFDASAGDKPILEAGAISFGPTANVHYPPVTVDHVVKDGETVSAGDVHLTAHLTPGHTPGCTSWTWNETESGKTYRVIDICSVSVAGNPLVNNKAYPRIVEDYRASIAKLKAMHADVFLAPHAGFYDPQGKEAARKAGRPNPFVDSAALQNFMAKAEAAFDKELARQQAGEKP
ncbi:MAG: subclass B3 metallo-beta-lactamase [Proteobacteria bacterium]|nr:subclass B3 metallo-beta-lactamase [Pseudomonadota bacterium]